MPTMMDALLEMAATEFVESYGGEAPPLLYERAYLSEENGRGLAARTWRDMAEFAERLLAQDAD